jgi:hypothetical protein
LKERREINELKTINIEEMTVYFTSLFGNFHGRTEENHDYVTKDGEPRVLSTGLTNGSHKFELGE